MGYDVVGLGLCTHDFLAIIPRMPQFESAVSMKAWSEQGGGPAATAMVAASRLGASAAFLGAVGDDASGRLILADFARYGVDTQAVQIRSGVSSHHVICLVEESSGDRAFIGNNATVQPLQPAEIDYELIRSAKYLHIDGHGIDGCLAAARAAKAAGVTVVMDASHYGYSPDVLALVDILIPSRFFFHAMGVADPIAAAQQLLSYGPQEVIITLGSDGCACANATESFHLPSFTIQPVVDTTGCGDVFHGAYIAGKLHGYNMRQAAQFASAAAGLKVRQIGGRLGIPTSEEVLQYLHEQLPTEWPVRDSKKPCEQRMISAVCQHKQKAVGHGC